MSDTDPSTLAFCERKIREIRTAAKYLPDFAGWNRDFDETFTLWEQEGKPDTSENMSKLRAQQERGNQLLDQYRKILKITWEAHGMLVMNLVSEAVDSVMSWDGKAEAMLEGESGVTNRIKKLEKVLRENKKQ